MHAPQVSKRNVGAELSPLPFSTARRPTCAIKTCYIFSATTYRKLFRHHARNQATLVRRKFSDIRTNPINFICGRDEGARSRVRGPRMEVLILGTRLRCPHIISAARMLMIASAGDDRGVRAFGDLINDLSFITVLPVDFSVRRRSRRSPSSLRS